MSVPFVTTLTRGNEGQKERPRDRQQPVQRNSRPLNLPNYIQWRYAHDRQKGIDVAQSFCANEGWHKRGTGLFASYCPHIVAQSCMHQSVHALSHILACIKVSTNCRAFLYVSECPQTVAHFCMHQSVHTLAISCMHQCPHTVAHFYMHQRVTTHWRTVLYAYIKRVNTLSHIIRSVNTLSHSLVCTRMSTNCRTA